VYFRNPVADNFFRNVVEANRIEHGTFEDEDKVRALAAEHDMVINTGSSFDPALTRAIVEGLKQRKGVAKGTLIHVSGGGNFIDNRTDGKFSADSKVWNVSSVYTQLVERRSCLLLLICSSAHHGLTGYE
jgi:hypothetical protein